MAMEKLSATARCDCGQNGYGRTNRKNTAGYTWNRGTNRAETNEQLGLFPVVGLEWRF